MNISTNEQVLSISRGRTKNFAIFLHLTANLLGKIKKVGPLSG